MTDTERIAKIDKFERDCGTLGPAYYMEYVDMWLSVLLERGQRIGWTTRDDIVNADSYDVISKLVYCYAATLD